jgi:hypothetical protein
VEKGEEMNPESLFIISPMAERVEALQRMHEVLYGGKYEPSSKPRIKASKYSPHQSSRECARRLRQLTNRSKGDNIQKVYQNKISL